MRNNNIVTFSPIKNYLKKYQKKRGASNLDNIMLRFHLRFISIHFSLKLIYYSVNHYDRNYRRFNSNSGDILPGTKCSKCKPFCYKLQQVFDKDIQTSLVVFFLPFSLEIFCIQQIAKMFGNVRRKKVDACRSVRINYFL